MMDHPFETDPEKIGDFLVRIGVMQPWQSRAVLLAQHKGDARLFGEIAIELGYIEDAALQLYVESHSRQSLGKPCEPPPAQGVPMPSPSRDE